MMYNNVIKKFTVAKVYIHIIIQLSYSKQVKSSRNQFKPSPILAPAADVGEEVHLCHERDECDVYCGADEL